MMWREMVEFEYIRSCDLLDGRCGAVGGIKNDLITLFGLNAYQHSNFGGNHKTSLNSCCLKKEKVIPIYILEHSMLKYLNEFCKLCSVGLK